MERARSLRVVGDPPYFMEYTLDDAEIVSITASYGAIVSDRVNRVRQPGVRMRVGDAKLDNSNHIYSDAYRGARYDPSLFPIDDNYETLRLGFWLATDRAYKQALEALARKKASLKNITVTETLADFSAAPPVTMVEQVARPPLDIEKWRTAVKEVSALFSTYPEVLWSDVNVGISRTISYLMNNEGTQFRIPDHLASLRIRASGLSSEGMAIRDYEEFHSFDAAGLPNVEALKAAAVRVAESVRAQIKGKYDVDNYSGPVLFEGVAAPQLMAELLGRGLSITRRPVSDPDRPINLPAGDLEGRIGSRILPEWLDVVDDPTQKEYQGKRLMGYYPVDIEGVTPKALPLVEKGVLKSYFATRQPIQGVTGSNGHARLKGGLGNNAALAGNLFIKASQTLPAADLKKRLLEIGKQRNKPFVIVVRKLDFPSTASLDELRRIAGGQQGKIVSRPIAVFKLFPDGREELIRGVRFRGLNVRSLKEIAAASDQTAALNFLENGAPFAHMDAGGYVAPTTIIAPGLLFEDVELEKIPGELPKLPVVPAPPLTH